MWGCVLSDMKNLDMLVRCICDGCVQELQKERTFEEMMWYMHSSCLMKCQLGFCKVGYLDQVWEQTGVCIGWQWVRLNRPTTHPP